MTAPGVAVRTRREATMKSIRQTLGALSVLACITAAAQAQQPCGTGTYPFPYTDVSAVTDPFCPGIMQAYVTGISKGTSPTTFSPNNDVPRLQMATFLQRTVDQVLARGSRRAALNRWWTMQNSSMMQTIFVGGGEYVSPQFCAVDGNSIWTTNDLGNQIDQVQADTGAVLGQWTSYHTEGVLAAGGTIFVIEYAAPGVLDFIAPMQPPARLT